MGRQYSDSRVVYDNKKPVQPNHLCQHLKDLLRSGPNHQRETGTVQEYNPVKSDDKNCFNFFSLSVNQQPTTFLITKLELAVKYETPQVL